VDFLIPHNKKHHRICVAVASLKLVFILTPKVASNAILDALGRYHGISNARTWSDRSVFPAMTLDEVRYQVPDWPRIMFVRNPFDRLIGTYEYHIRAMKLTSSWTLKQLGFRVDMTFRDFLLKALVDPEADEHLAYQCWQSDRVDFLGRFENLDDDWKRLRDGFRIDLPLLDVINSSGDHRDRRQYFDEPELQHRVESAYDIDLRTFNYGL